MKKNKHRHTRHFILGLFIILLPLSCENFFEIEPVSTYAPENVFETVDFTRQAILGVYQIMTEDEGYSKRLSMYYTVDTDESRCSGDYLDNGRRDIARYAATSGNTELSKPWINLYVGINNANICIERIPQSPVYTSGDKNDIEEMNRMLGEAMTLRALYYFELIRNWGDVPFRDKPTRAGENLYLPKTDRDSIYEFIINDLLIADTLVPWRSEVPSDERITKGAVKGLLARIALARGGYSLRLGGVNARGSNYLEYYQIARDACYEIMESGEHLLNPSFEDVFRKHCRRELDTEYGESMWEAGMGIYRSGEVGYYVGNRIDANSRYGKADGGINAIPTYYLSFDSLDTRRDVTIALYQIDSDNLRLIRAFTDLNIAKWRREWIEPIFPGSDKYNGVNWVFLRYSDVLLMFAEAENELNSGPTSAAVDALRQVRERAYGENSDQMPGIPNDKEGFFNEIVRERWFEFGGEGIRKYDLIRWNMLGSAITGMKEELSKLQLGEEPYAEIPRKIVWRNEGEEYEILNMTYNMDSVQIASRDSIYWPNVTNWADDVDQEYIDLVAGYFIEGRKELLPIHQSIIDTNPNLENDFGL